MTFNVFVSDHNGANPRLVGRVSSREHRLAYEHALRKFKKSDDEFLTLERKRFKKYTVVHYRYSVTSPGTSSVITALCRKRFCPGFSENLRVTADERKVTCVQCRQRLEGI